MDFKIRFRAAGALFAVGIAAVGALLLVAVAAPLLANNRPLFFADGDGVSFPFWRAFFAGDAPERRLDALFNYALLLAFASAALVFTRRRKKILFGLLAVGVALPFFLVQPRVDKRDWRAFASERAATVLFAPIPYGPFETAAKPYLGPSREHWCGTDEIGRDVAARLVYGARVSLAVGILSSLLALGIGTPIGLGCGYFGGKFDLFTMRITEILLCFPSFLLLLILMGLGADNKMEESVPLLVAVIAATGWIGFATLVRGETLRLRNAPFVENCRVSGVPAHRILFREILPNVAAVIAIAFPFSVAGAILAESSLSFLGFGVRPPTASWGNLLRQAFDNPLEYGHLTFFPGLLLFWTTLGFHFTGEGLRRMLAVRE